MWGDALPLGHGCSAKEPEGATLPAMATMSPCPSPQIGAGGQALLPVGVTPCPHLVPTVAPRGAQPRPAAGPNLWPWLSPLPAAPGPHPSQPAGDVAPKGRLLRPGAPQLPGRTMAHPCPGPSPRDNNGRSRSRLSSSPPESLEGAGAGGGPWAERQRLPPSPALSALHQWLCSHPAICTPPGDTGCVWGDNSSISGIQRAPLGSCQAPASLPHGLGLPTADRLPDPPSSCFVSRCARALSVRERPGEVTSIPPAPALCAGQQPAQGEAAPAPRHPGVVPTSPFLSCPKTPLGLRLCPRWAEEIPGGGMAQPCY